MKILSALFVCLATLSQAQEVGPGAQSPDPAVVPGLFRTICLDTLPDFANAESQMLNSGLFLRNERTGTIYHQTLNFSGKVLTADSGKLQCSVVFYSDASIETVQPMLEAARDAFQAEFNASNPNASIETLSATGQSAGFHRMAIFIDITQ